MTGRSTSIGVLPRVIRREQHNRPDQNEETEMTTIQESKTVRNPNTGGKWQFPRDARRYASRIQKCYDAPSCYNGHFGCALWEDGPCLDEELSNAGIVGDDNY